VCGLYVLRLGQLCGSCDWDVSVFVAYCLVSLWGIVCLREVMPVFPLPPLGSGYGVGKLALFPQLVPSLSTVCEVWMGLVLCVYCCDACGVCEGMCPLLCDV
jgi:hypothetical protein